MLTRLMVVVLFGCCATEVRAEFKLTQIERSASLAPFIVGGAPADPDLWPATLIFDAPNRCTATVVGPKAILTAAHCLDGSTSGEALINGQTLALKCQTNPKYPADTTADIAMCGASSTITAPNLKYEVLNTDAATVKAGDGIVLLGYGCLAEGGPVSDTLYVGSATVKKIPVKFNRYEVQGGAKLCGGDSGGAGYVMLDSTTRIVFGVNESQVPGTKTSYLSSVSTADDASFIKLWGATTGNKICGLDGGLADCRQ
ncbi:S1 family peptidase [Mesorhizobium australicum]|uniref:trypsin-like serine protease n=1 Tax=Mesorhizobium australicum TaxID=536018 RepID=UPI0033364A39